MTRGIYFSAVFTLTFLLLACSEDSLKPAYHYHASIESEQISQIESFIRKTGKKWNLNTFEKNRDELKIASFGKDAFYIELRHKNDPILWVSNVGDGVTLQVLLFNYNKLPESQLAQLANEVKSGLQEKLNISLEAGQP